MIVPKRKEERNKEWINERIEEKSEIKYKIIQIISIKRRSENTSEKGKTVMMGIP